MNDWMNFPKSFPQEVVGMKILAEKMEWRIGKQGVFCFELTKRKHEYAAH